MPQPISTSGTLISPQDVPTAREVGGGLDKSKRWRPESTPHTSSRRRSLGSTRSSQGAHRNFRRRKSARGIRDINGEGQPTA